MVFCIYTLRVISWDEPKRQANIRKHGIDLSELEEVFDYPMVTNEDTRDNYREVRLRSLGFWRGRVVFMVWTERADSAHLISCRYADRSEVKDYFTNLH